MTMGICNNTITTVNIFEPLPIDFTLDDLQEKTKPFSDDFSLYDFSPLCIPNDSLDDIGWLLPSLPDFSKTTDSKPVLSLVDFPTTPEQEIKFNSNKRSLPKDFHQEEQQHQHVSSLKKKKLRSKRSSCGSVWYVNVNTLLPVKRRCTHCGTEETPQWRMGPKGPKTLCNACGVRYNKSGRLVPEYRPAASPTFNSQVHSNSHRKIVQMRMTKDV